MRGGINTAMVTKNRMRDLGVFMTLLAMPIFLMSLGVCSAIQRIADFTAGLLPLFPADILYGGGFVLSMFGCVVLVAMGVFVFWAAFPVYKEHLNNG